MCWFFRGLPKGLVSVSLDLRYWWGAKILKVPLSATYFVILLGEVAWCCSTSELSVATDRHQREQEIANSRKKKNLSKLEIYRHKSREGASREVWEPSIIYCLIDWWRLFPVKGQSRTTLAVQWFRICLPVQRIPVWTLIREDSICCGIDKPASHKLLSLYSATREATTVGKKACERQQRLATTSATRESCTHQWSKTQCRENKFLNIYKYIYM